MSLAAGRVVSLGAICSVGAAGFAGATGAIFAVAIEPTNASAWATMIMGVRSKDSVLQLHA